MVVLLAKSEQYYVSKVSILARKSCVDAGILDDSDKKLDMKKLSKIVCYFAGFFGIDKGSNLYVIRHSNNSFDIVLGNQF